MSFRHHLILLLTTEFDYYAIEGMLLLVRVKFIEDEIIHKMACWSTLDSGIVDPLLPSYLLRFLSLTQVSYPQTF